MTKRVLVVTRDLMFRSKLRAVVAAAGGTVVADDGECDLAVIELETAGVEQRIQAFVGRGVRVLAFGSHVKVEELRRARALGAEAVANSQVEGRLRELVAS